MQFDPKGKLVPNKMNSLYLLCFFGLGSSVFSLPTIFQENNTGDHFDYHNISVAISTIWDSQLNITNVSSANDPNAKLVLYYNVSQTFGLPNSKPRFLNLEVLENTDLYKEDEDYFQRQVTDALSLDDNVDISISLGAVGNILREVDFSDNFSKRSYIYYNVSFISEVNITYPYEKNIEQILQQYPELTHIQMPLVGEAVSGLIPLANGTGTDDTRCRYGRILCTTSTTRSKNMSTYYLLDDVTVINSLGVDADTRAFSTNNVGGKSIYTTILYLNLQYQVVIGQHRC